MYVKDFRASIRACKDLKINKKTLKIIVIMLNSIHSCWIISAISSYNKVFFPRHIYLFFYLIRISRPKVLCEKSVLRSFTKFKGKHLCQRLFINKVAGTRSATLLKKRSQHKCFPLNFVRFLRALFLRKTSSGCFSLIYKH